MIYHSDMWDYRVDGNPLEEVSIHVLRGDHRNVIAFSFSEKILAQLKKEQNLNCEIEKITISAITFKYCMKKMASALI